MHCYLTPYFHLLTHRDLFIYCLGSVYGFWLFGPEANNGHLVKVNTNGHTRGELKSTMMWSWIKNILIHDLVSASCAAYQTTRDPQIHALEGIKEKSVDDVIVIRKLRNYLKGNRKSHCMRGTLLNMITSQRYHQGANGQCHHFIECRGWFFSLSRPLQGCASSARNTR